MGLRRWWLRRRWQRRYGPLRDAAYLRAAEQHERASLLSGPIGPDRDSR